jgi:hypothetical protein
MTLSEKQAKKYKPKISLAFPLSERQEEIYNHCRIGNGIQYVKVCTGRQVGKTLICTVTAAAWALGYASFKIGFFLPVYKQCKKVFKGLKKMLTPLHGSLSFNHTDLIVEFWNGSTIQFFTSENDNCRGETFDAIIVDEACFIKDEIWTQAIQPTVNASLSKPNALGLIGFHGKVLLTSTPKTKNWFFGQVKDEGERKVTIRFTTEEGGRIHKSILEDTKKGMPEAAYRNEYLGEFLDAGGNLFDYPKCLMNLAEYIALPKSGHMAAVDVASKEDYTVLTILDKKMRVLVTKKWRYLEYSDIMQRVAIVLREYGSPPCYVETNGVGEGPYQLLRAQYSHTRDWFTGGTQPKGGKKVDIIINLQIKFNTGAISIPDIQDLKDELDHFTCEWIKGKPVFGGSNGVHDDRVMSLAIAVYNMGKVQTFELNMISNQKKQQNY